MAWFSAEVSGEVDILQRLERRVEEKRFLGVDSSVVYRIVDEPKRVGDIGYRKAVPRERTLHVELTSTFPALFEEITLDIGDGGRVRYCARFPKAYRSTGIVGLAFGAAIVAVGAVLGLEVVPALGILFAVLGVLAGVLFASLTSIDAQNRVPAMVLKILREETIEARRDDRLRAELGLEKKTETETEK